MQLNTSSIPASVRKAGQGRCVITSGQLLKIETSPQGEEILNVGPPAGKKWTISLKVDVVESDV